MMKGLRIKAIQFVIWQIEEWTFYPKLIKFYKEQLRADKLRVIDVGANKGQSIDLFLSINPNAQITAFEPNRDLFQMLSSKYSDIPGIQILQKGVSNQDSKLLFYQNVLNETSSFELLNPESKYLASKAAVLGVKVDEIIESEYEVEVTTLATYLNNDPRHIDVLKIDVEGHEYQCLLGLLERESNLPNIRFIQLEYHEDDMYASAHSWGDYVLLLGKHGYNEAHRIKHSFGSFYDVIFENNRLAVQ